MVELPIQPRLRRGRGPGRLRGSTVKNLHYVRNMGMDGQQAPGAAQWNRASALPSMEYPWDGLEQRLGRELPAPLPLIGYGSLVNASSASPTLSPPAAKPLPVRAWGARRVFDYPMAPDQSRYGPPKTPRACAALNIHVTKTSDDWFNGILMSVNREDVPRLRERERGYALEPLPYEAWDSSTESGIAWALAYPTGQDKRGLLPHEAYYGVCRAGAASYGPEFLDAWLSTTFLADGTTTVQTWEQTKQEEESA